jgi:hypothetical protein
LKNAALPYEEEHNKDLVPFFINFVSRRKKNKNMKVYFKIIFLFLVLSLWTGCSNDFTDKLAPVQAAFGKINELVLVADKSVWEGDIGDTIRYYLSSAYIILPQPEPILDIRYYEPKDLKSVSGRKNFRTYLFIGDLNDADSPTTRMIKEDIGSEGVYRANEDPAFNLSVGNNKWSKDQILIYQFAKDKTTLIDNIKKNAATILKRVNRHDREVVNANIYQGGENLTLISLVESRMGVELKIPYDYFLALDDSTATTIWIRKETDYLSSNIFLHKFPYKDQEQLSKKGIKNQLNRMGLYVSTEIDGTYKHINDVDLPIYTTNMQLDGKFAVETRGIWEIENDFMGGPYISYSILNPTTNEILLVEGFIHAPSKNKRDYMQQLEHIFGSLKFR